MTTYGLTSTGFNAKTYTEIVAELEASFKGVFGASIDLSPQGPFGQLIGIMAEREASAWDASQDVYGAFDPDAATGQALDAVCALTGTLRHPATHSTVTLTVTGTAGTTIPAGSIASVAGTEVQFATDVAVTFSGTFTTQTVAATAVLTGPLPALTGYLTVIDTPVAGWTAVTNLSDAVLGENEETDAALRLRREVELRNPSNAALDAIRVKVLAVPLVTGCYVWENVTMVTDGDGIPAKSVYVVVSGTATAAAVAAAIFDSVAAGIGTYGGTTATVVDSMGNSHTIAYDTAAIKTIYVRVDIVYDADHYPVDGDTQAAALVLAAGQMYVIGQDVISRRLAAPLFGIEGVLDASTLVSITYPGSGDSVTVSKYQIATFDSARIEVFSTPGTP